MAFMDLGERFAAAKVKQLSLLPQAEAAAAVYLVIYFFGGCELTARKNAGQVTEVG